MPAKIDIGIKEADRKAIADALAKLLADTYVLYFKTHGFHWNVTGSDFPQLHTMFMTQYTEMWTALDELAERIRSLGVVAPASGKALAALASVKEADGAPPAKEMVKDLLAGHEAVARSARKLLEIAQGASDESTADVAIARLQVHEKTAWMLRAYLG